MRILGLWVVLLLSSPVLLSSTTPNASGPSLTSTSLGTVPRGVAVDSSSGEIYVVLYLNGTTLALDGHTLETVAKVAVTAISVGVLLWRRSTSSRRTTRIA